METKDEIRRIVRERKKEYAPEELESLSEKIVRAVEESAEFQHAQTVAAYWSLSDEVETHRLVERWCEKKRILQRVSDEPGGIQHLRT